MSARLRIVTPLPSEPDAVPVVVSPDDGADWTARVVARSRAWAWRVAVMAVVWLFVILLLGYVFFLLDERDVPARIQRARAAGARRP